MTIAKSSVADLATASERKNEKNKRGILNQVKRMAFETRVSNYYTSQGFFLKRHVQSRYGDFDLVATKESGSVRAKRLTLLIDCKKYEKGPIPIGEFVMFVRKFVRYYDHYEGIQSGDWVGVFAYVGRLDRKIRPYWRSIPDKDWILLKPFRK